jgi:hypothetical protein
VRRVLSGWGAGQLERMSAAEFRGAGVGRVDSVSPVRGVDLRLVPDQHRDAAAVALRSALGESSPVSVDAVGGGASGALTYRVRGNGHDAFMRIETIRGPLRNPHQYACMQAAADAGVAPPILFADDQSGVLVVPFIEAVPLTDMPGGPVAVIEEMGQLIRRLQATEVFPAYGDYVTNLGRILDHLRTRAFAPGLLDAHVEAFDRIRAAWSRDPSTFVSSHNDPNAMNVLYDGRRLWLIDWETASRNDPLVDVAVASHFVAETDDLRALLLRTWLGHEPDPPLEARFFLARSLTQLYAASIIHIVVPSPEPVTDLAAPTPDELRSLVVGGHLVLGTPEFSRAFANTLLALFLDTATSTDFNDALRIASG